MFGPDQYEMHRLRIEERAQTFVHDRAIRAAFPRQPLPTRIENAIGDTLMSIGAKLQDWGCRLAVECGCQDARNQSRPA